MFSVLTSSMKNEGQHSKYKFIRAVVRHTPLKIATLQYDSGSDLQASRMKGAARQRMRSEALML